MCLIILLMDVLLYYSEYTRTHRLFSSLLPLFEQFVRAWMRHIWSADDFKKLFFPTWNYCILTASFPPVFVSNRREEASERVENFQKEKEKKRIHTQKNGDFFFPWEDSQKRHQQETIWTGLTNQPSIAKSTTWTKEIYALAPHFSCGRLS